MYFLFFFLFAVGIISPFMPQVYNISCDLQWYFQNDHIRARAGACRRIIANTIQNASQFLEMSATRLKICRNQYHYSIFPAIVKPIFKIVPHGTIAALALTGNFPKQHYTILAVDCNRFFRKKFRLGDMDWRYIIAHFLEKSSLFSKNFRKFPFYYSIFPAIVKSIFRKFHLLFLFSLGWGEIFGKRTVRPLGRKPGELSETGFL